MFLFLFPKAQSMQWVEYASPRLISLGIYVGWVTFQFAMICADFNSKGSASPRQLHPVETKKAGQKDMCYNFVYCVLTSKETQELCCWIPHTLIHLINPISSHPGGPNGNEHSPLGRQEEDKMTIRCSLSFKLFIRLKERRQPEAGVWQSNLSFTGRSQGHTNPD